MEANSFEVKVAAYYVDGLSKGQAVKKAAEKHPDLHAAYLEKLQAGGEDGLKTIGESLRAGYANSNR